MSTIVTFSATNYYVYQVNLSNKNLIPNFKNGNQANSTEYVDIQFITVYFLKSILPWTAPDMSLLFLVLYTYKCLIQEEPGNFKFY